MRGERYICAVLVKHVSIIYSFVFCANMSLSTYHPQRSFVPCIREDTLHRESNSTHLQARRLEQTSSGSALQVFLHTHAEQLATQAGPFSPYAVHTIGAIVDEKGYAAEITTRARTLASSVLVSHVSVCIGAQHA